MLDPFHLQRVNKLYAYRKYKPVRITQKEHLLIWNSETTQKPKHLPSSNRNSYFSSYKAWKNNHGLQFFKFFNTESTSKHKNSAGVMPTQQNSLYCSYTYEKTFSSLWGTCLLEIQARFLFFSWQIKMNNPLHVGLILILSKVFTIFCLLCLCRNREYPGNFQNETEISKLFFQMSAQIKWEGRSF